MYLSRILGCTALAFAASAVQVSAQPRQDFSQGNNQKQSQGFKVSGKLVDEQKKPVSYTTVTLLRSDSSVAGGDMTQEDGFFNIDVQDAGTYTLRISGLNINTKNVGGVSVSPSNPERRLGNITIAQTTQVMKGVEVTGERAYMEISADKKVYNVERNITTAGGSASDVLQNIPSLSVDVDGTVNLRGKSGATILIDGKPATLLGGDAASALQSLPAATIQSVEVITNPSARYDAQGMNGIINIVTKRNKQFGINGSVSAGAGTHDKYNGGLNLNLKNNKWNLFVNSNFRLNKNYNRTTTERTNTGNSGYYKSYEDNLRSFNGWFNSLGAEYTVNKRTTIGITQNINLMQWGGNGTSNYDVYTSPEYRTSAQNRSSYSLGGPFSSSTSADYKHKFAKEKQEISSSVTFAKTWVHRNQEYETNIYDHSGNLMSGPVLQKAPGNGTNTSLTAQADYTMPLLGKNGKLDAGWKSQLFWFDSKNNPVRDSANTGEKVDSILLTNYNYKQQIHALYTSYSNQAGKWNYSAGLRFEYAGYEGTSLSVKGNTYKYDFVNLFPSAFLSYKLPKDQGVYLSYSMRTNRPGFMQMMPFLDLSNPQDTNMGNPGLKPEFIHNTELNYNKQVKKNNFIVSVYYQYTKNMIERYRKFYADGTSFTQPQNLTSGVTYGLELMGKLQLLPMWDATPSFNFFRNEILGTNIDPALNNSGFSWFGKLNTNLKLPAGFSFQLNGNYEAPKVAGQGKLKEVYWVDVAIKKNLFKNKATLTANLSDIFNTRKYTTNYVYPAYIQSVYRDRETRIGNISFSYRFGKSEFKGMGNGGNRKKNEQNNPQIPEKERENLKTDDNTQQNGF